MEQFASIHVEPQEAGQRLDVWCVAHFPAYSRAALQRAIKSGQVTVNGQAVKPRQVVQAGDEIIFTAPPAAAAAEQSSSLDPISLPIVYEDNRLVVVNKPAGLAVHPGVGREQQTVAGWFANRYPDSKGVGEYDRPGIVHRLDKDTSGVMVLAKDGPTFEMLKDQFKKHWAKKEYLALVFGVPGEKKGRITRPLARSQRNPMRRTVDPLGKPAITEWVLEEKFAKQALLRVFPLTGRTHQIRAHLHFLGFPIVGDPLYTFKRQSLPSGVTARTGQMLHAEKLTLRLPNGKRKTFAAPAPEDFQAVLRSLREE